MAEASVLTRILVCDDHPMFRDALDANLSRQPGFEVVGEAGDGQQAIDLFRSLGPDVVLMDLQMPRKSGVDAITTIVAEDPSARILVLTTFDTDADIIGAVRAGAKGYLLKNAPREEFVQAVRDVARGRGPSTPNSVERPADTVLSFREIEVLKLLVDGATNRRISRELFVSEATVKFHLGKIYEKLEVPDRTSAVSAAIRRGLVRFGQH